ncbi:MAG: hypothetical protein IJO65_10875 [Lachnospiraceae bacterium]|nr:hypothetical protein [Lachnospiraceae bacterium]
MNTLMKVLTTVLGVLAVIACVATIGIIGYSMSDGNTEKDAVKETDKKVEKVAAKDAVTQQEEKQDVIVVAPSGQQPTPLVAPNAANSTTDPDHIHDYEEEIEQKATCYQAGRLRYHCDCGDSYFVDISSTGHVEDAWVVQKEATKEHDGLKVKKCIYCDEVVAQEIIPYEGDETDAPEEKHYHQYTPRVEREPSCVLAGLRKYSCVCGSFYTEKISALGHVASDWTIAAAPTTTTLGTEQRTCNVCGVVLDSRPVNTVSATPAASGSASPTATTSGNTTATATPAGTTASATPTAAQGGNPSASPDASATPANTLHAHSYTSYVLKEPTCAEKGIRSFVCTCGSSYAELIDVDPNNHSFQAVITAPTKNSSGFTTYTCVWCAYSYVDNYVSATG